MVNFYQANGDILYRDVSLSGGTTITLHGNMDFSALESSLKSSHDNLMFRKLTDLRTGEVLAFIIESSSQPEEITPDIEEILGYELTEENSSIEFSGPSLGEGFYKQLLIALALSFFLMTLVIFFLFRSVIPSLSIILVAFADIIAPLAIVNLMGIRLSAAGIAAFLMLIGYCVDTNILLTTRAIRNREGSLNSRIYGAFKTGTFMTITALLAVLPAFFIVTGLPDSFRQIFLILGLGLCADLVNTWMMNAGIIKWYCARKNID